MGFFGAIKLRLKATTRSSDLLNDMRKSQNDDKKEFLIEQAAMFSFDIDEDSEWPIIFSQIISAQLYHEYTNKGKSLDEMDSLIILQAVGNALSESYPNDESVQQFLSSLPFDV